MNFLLHRHFAALELSSSRAAFGAMLPDLVRLVDRRWRARRDVAALPASTPELGEVLLGIDHHLDADVWFHRSEEFKEGERATAEAFRTAGATAPRLTLFAHATWELLLDGAWVRREGERAIEASLRAEARDFADEAALAIAHHARESPGGSTRGSGSSGSLSALAAPALARLWSGLPELASGYATAPGVARRLAGMRAAFGMPRADETELGRWIEAFRAMEAPAERALASLEATRGLARAASTTDEGPVEMERRRSVPAQAERRPP